LKVNLQSSICNFPILANPSEISGPVKKIAVIPTLLTLGNAICGFAAIAAASKIGPKEAAAETDWYFALSGWLIIGAMLFDGLDGYVARISKTASDFGVQLDSLCDAISFGLAPAFLLLRLGPDRSIERLHQALAVIAALYVCCTLLRLARYNVEADLDPNSGKRFRGLPSPGAAGCLASLAILRGIFTESHLEALAQRWPALRPDVLTTTIQVWATLGALTVSILMVSRIPYPHLTKQILWGRDRTLLAAGTPASARAGAGSPAALPGRLERQAARRDARHFRHLVQVIIFVAAFVLIRELVVVPIFWLYALGMPIRYYLARLFRRAVPAAEASARPAPNP
jgi:CDP-diacylglycerol--serine O-phosphatidyltransferase